MIEVSWFDDEQTIVCYTFPRKWSWNELEQAFHNGKILYTSVNHIVNILIDIRDSDVPHPSLTIFGDGIANTKPLNCGLTIIITNNPAIDMVARFASQFWRSQWEFESVDNMDDALQKISDYSASV